MTGAGRGVLPLMKKILTPGKRKKALLQPQEQQKQLTD
jgi:hypothetical protein